MTRFRLAAQPGLVRANSHIRTVVGPQLDIRVVHQVPAKEPIRRVVGFMPPPPTPTPAPTPTPIVLQPPAQQQDIIRRTIVNTRQVTLNKTRDDAFDTQSKGQVVSLRNVGRGRVLVIIACGPSIKEVALEKLRNIEPVDMMSINKPDSRIHPTRYWVFCDQTQYTRNIDLFNTYQGTLVNAWTIGAKHPNQVLVKVLQGRGFSKNLCLGFHIGRSTTYAAMQVAYWMGYDKVYIFGCDMGAVNGQMHFYGKNPDVEHEERMRRFKLEAEHYAYGAQLLSSEERQRYVFCSTYNKFPFVDQFSRMDQAEAITSILDLAKIMRGQDG